MATRSDSTNSKPAPRHPAGHTKSSRQQFSACGACRIRRVRCDLKDLPESSACSNCREHGFNCVDEFRDVKAVKLLRRGRRIQQVEAVYGAGSSPDHENYISIPRSTSSNHSIIPRLDPRFFDSRFYARFHIQRPIIEPGEFKARYTAFSQGNYEALGVAGQLIAMLLVIWAASYGVDECGREEPHDGAQGVRRRKKRTNDMVQELLQLIDHQGIPRKPSWDGVRVLLLVMPLTEEVAQPLERLTMYETAINQVYTLCSLASPRSVNSGQGEQVDALVRARIYWYAFVHEGITTGLRGGRLHLADDDLAVFQTLQEAAELPMTRSQLTLSYSHRWALAPLRLASACRQVNSALTGSKACARQSVDEVKLNEAWESIENCWEEFESLRQLGLLGILTIEEADRFVDGWKIFIFECHNVIREFLKQRLLSALGEGDSPHIIDPESQQAVHKSLLHLHTIAESKCQDVAQHVVSLVRRHLGTSFFEYDASLVRDGCFFAGYMLPAEAGTDEQENVCLRALSEMRWAFSKSEERIQTLQLIWEARQRVTRPPPVPVVHETPPPADSFPNKAAGQATLDVPLYFAHADGRQWTESDQRHSTTMTSSPGVVATSQFPDDERTTSFHDPSISSGSSALSTESPYTPAAQPMVASYSFPSQFDSKHEQLSHPHMSDHGPPAISLANPPERLGYSTTFSTERSYQRVEQTAHPNLAHRPQYTGPSEERAYVGPDGALHRTQIPDTGQPHLSHETNYSYSSDAPYSYS